MARARFWHRSQPTYWFPISHTLYSTLSEYSLTLAKCNTLTLSIHFTLTLSVCLWCGCACVCGCGRIGCVCVCVWRDPVAWGPKRQPLYGWYRGGNWIFAFVQKKGVVIQTAATPGKNTFVKNGVTPRKQLFRLNIPKSPPFLIGGHP